MKIRILNRVILRRLHPQICIGVFLSYYMCRLMSYAFLVRRKWLSYHMTLSLITSNIYVLAKDIIWSYYLLNIKCYCTPLRLALERDERSVAAGLKCVLFFLCYSFMIHFNMKISRTNFVFL